MLASVQPLLLRHLCACHRDESSAASAARETFFQPKDLVWLDSCDKHRNEGPRCAATTSSEAGRCIRAGASAPPYYLHGS
ncbi:hypothetical protein CEJ86_25745 [Sinorhizobium meliloti]|uniref:Uncharacterized protein n=1 Tax=Rhizobium meliloti TaxID=382 RepID=A0A2J0YW77_RHIML|nr:hypothetical protein CEJ86_25745 [Sinorhizobium meliloti]